MTLLTAWTGPIPLASTRKSFFLDFFYHPTKRQVAKIYLTILQKVFGLKIIGITGSFGKTTTKDILYSLLSRHSETIAARDNIDPIYNIPSTIFRARPATRFLILEMGIEHIGEMNFYNWLAPIDIAIITGIGLAHTQYLRDIETIVAEKSLIGKHAKQTFVSRDDQNIKVVTHGKIVRVAPEKDLHLPFLGDHFKTDASLAIAVAKFLGKDQSEIDAELRQLIPTSQRMFLIKHSSGALIIDDSYNANPSAVLASLTTLFDLARKKKRSPVFVFGQMNELGKYEKESHKKIGRFLKINHLKHLLTLGPATKYTIETAGVGDRSGLISELKKKFMPFLDRRYCLLIKGSRSWHLEDLLRS